MTTTKPEDVEAAIKNICAYVTARDFMNTGIMDFVDDHPTGATDGDPVVTLMLSDLRTLLASHAALVEGAGRASKLLGWARTCVPFPSDCHAAIVAYITDNDQKAPANPGADA